MDSHDIDHRAVIASLSVADRAALTARDDGPGLLRIGIHGGAILLLAVLVLAGVPFWPLLMLPLGILIVFLFTALHEAIHETAFRSEKLGRVVATVCGFLVLVPPLWFRFFHFAHHRHTNDPDDDPELMSPRPETWREYLVYLSGIPYWKGMASALLGNAFGRSDEPYVPNKARAKVAREARIFLAAYALLFVASVLFGTAALFWVWILPALLGQPFLRAYLLAEHARCPHVANMLQNTRTTFTTDIVRFFAWNMPYHAEHHAYPAVPFHSLPRFHEIVREHLGTTERGYVRFNRKFVRSLR